MRARRLILLVLIALLSACGSETAATLPTAIPATETPAPTPTPSCQDLAAAYKQAVDKELRRFDDALKVARSTPRMSLATQIAALQEIQRDVEDMDVPECATKTHPLLVDSLESSVNAMLAFLQQSDQVLVDAFFEKAATERDVYNDALDRLIETGSTK